LNSEQAPITILSTARAPSASAVRVRMMLHSTDPLRPAEAGPRSVVGKNAKAAPLVGAGPPGSPKVSEVAYCRNVIRLVRLVSPPR